MELVTFESETFKHLMFNIEQNRKDTERAFKLLADARADKWLTPEEVEEYTGFKYTWIVSRKK